MERERIKQFDHFGLFENGPRLSLTVVYLLLSRRPNVPFTSGAPGALCTRNRPTTIVPTCSTFYDTH